MAGEAFIQNIKKPYSTLEEQASTPATPDTGHVRMYANASGVLSVVDDTGATSAVGGTDGATAVAAHEVTYDHTDIHEEDHAARHADGGADELQVEDLATAATDTSYALKPDGAGGVAFGAVSAVGSIGDLSDVDPDKSKTPADGDVLTYDGTHWNAETPAAGGGAVASGDDFELAFVEDTDGETVTATTDATADTILTLPEFTLSESTDVMVEVYLPSVYGSNRLWLNLYSGSTDLGRLGTNPGSTNYVEMSVSQRLTLAAGTYNLTIRAWQNGSSLTLGSGTGGSGTYLGMNARVIRANPTVNGGGSALTLDDISDVDMATDPPVSGEVLTYSDTPLENTKAYSTTGLNGLVNDDRDGDSDYTATASSTGIETPQTVIDSESLSTIWFSNDVSGSWWKMDCGASKTICPTYVAIQNRSASGNAPANFNIEGSVNGSDWDTLYTHSGGALATSAWGGGAVSTTERYRYFRVINTGADGSGSDYLVIANFEVWGTEYEAQDPKWVPAGAGVSSGTSFPTSPSTGDRYRRTDLDYKVYFYDGTRWVTENIYRLDMGPGDKAQNTSTAGVFTRAVVPYDKTIWLIDWEVGLLVASNNDGSNYWTANLMKAEPTPAYTTIDSVDTSGDTATQPTHHRSALGETLTGATWLYVDMAKTGSPGTVRVLGCAHYREVAT